jgi:diguanylate cyclase (GGDEF)-like protein
MFRRIYERSWQQEPNILATIVSRIFEEIAELAEAIRFFHLYPYNFDNELADFLAWWFALVTNLHQVSKNDSPILAEELLWPVYPGHCSHCGLRVCFCRPGPVRELISKPTPGELERLDRLTLVFNQTAYLEDVTNIIEGSEPIFFPVACVRVDIDLFKQANDTHGHEAGDQALRHLAALLRQKLNERDRAYRAGGDEFVILSPDTSREEASGKMRRIVEELRSQPVRWVSEEGATREFFITVSVGVAEASRPAELRTALEKADAAAYTSKQQGRDRMTIAQSVPASDEIGGLERISG